MILKTFPTILKFYLIVLKKVETAASNTPNKKAQKPTQKVNTSKKGSKYDFGEEDYYDEEDNYDEYDDYY